MHTFKKIPEEFLCYIWENRLFNELNLQSKSGQALQIVHTGQRNNHSGPDYFNAKVQIGATLWIGNVEIHKNSSDWYRHNHHLDQTYQNVILHVVLVNDVSVTNHNKELIPTIELRFPEEITSNYLTLLESRTWVACEKYLARLDPLQLQIGLNRLMIERLEDKTKIIEEHLQQNKNNWQETLYQMLARSFGLRENALPFELLGKAVPYALIQRHRDRLFHLESLLFGSSGLLNQQLIGDDYYLELREQYSFFYGKYKLKQLPTHVWKFMRMRPGNFPTLRIAQFSSLFYAREQIFSSLMECENISELIHFFQTPTSEYWRKHYNFNKPVSRVTSVHMGSKTIQTILINAVAPFLFVYGEKCNKPSLKERSLYLLENLEPESNSIVRKWHNLGIDCRSAFESQSLLQLKNNYCEKKKCLNCHIGNKLIASKKGLPDDPELQ